MPRISARAVAIKMREGPDTQVSAARNLTYIFARELTEAPETPHVQ